MTTGWALSGWRAALHRRTWGCWSEYELAMCTFSLETQEYHGLHQENCEHQVKGGDPPTVLHSHETPICSATSSSGAPNLGKAWSCWSKSRGGLKDAQRDGALILWSEAETAGFVQPGEERRLWRHLTVTFQYLKVDYRKNGEELFSGSLVTGQGKMASNWTRVGLD